MQEKLLDILHKNKGKYVFHEELASNLDISPEEVETNIDKLKELGYQFDFSSNLGYRLKESSTLLLPFEIKRDLETKYIGREIHYFSEVDSTNNMAKKLAEKGAEEGTMVIAETQSRGRGRRGKKWISPEGGIWMSTILRPHIPPADAPKLTLMTGVAVAKTLKKEFGLDVGIKWPNDILIGNKKVCGILTEANAKFNTVDYVVVGIGIDANVDTKIFPSEVVHLATSLKKELEEEIDRVKLVQSLSKIFEETYEEFKSGNFPDILNDWRNLSTTIGSYVEVRKRLGKIVRGEAIGITNTGALILELDDNTLRKVISGECIHIEK
ncbi:biotin--[acetyl-CoA-carboxylase] ligase [Methanobacterium alkalithermotolerans]|uniref:Biotin--[acetyl-CoA-carboxylase] ligase n=1 Tax=Methanobacterium alkalithermotolerans TaxID=2731220 RepID=A0A8T8K7K6_9EURY|nr:biotin--[acetyl-CoA-carboxylase] ligase [Methanobacterium alkalithermotolerans]QUH23899.1 biotin--[acetyl-CoA-carboxylase] ligase [Methanobacterium alkalithermotolerans]